MPLYSLTSTLGPDAPHGAVLDLPASIAAKLGDLVTPHTKPYRDVHRVDVNGPRVPFNIPKAKRPAMKAATPKADKPPKDTKASGSGPDDPANDPATTGA